MSAAPPKTYMFDNTTAAAKVQVPLLAELLDEHSRSILAPLVQSGDACLDLGAGACTISTWLADQVGPKGRVTAVDLNPLAADNIPANLTVITSDVHDLNLPPGSLQLIHARLLLMHLPDRLDLVRRFVEALAPGGWLVVSDWAVWDGMVLDAPSDDAVMLLGRFQSHLLQLGTTGGMDITWARTANRALYDAGLNDVQTTTFARSWAGGTGICRLHDSNSRQKEHELVASGFGLDDLHALREVLADPDLVLQDYLMHTTVGRKTPLAHG